MKAVIKKLELIIVSLERNEIVMISDVIMLLEDLCEELVDYYENEGNE